MKSKISAEYLFPAFEKRYFIQKNSVVRAQFATHDFNNVDDPQVAADNLAFLEQQFVDRFYPYVFDSLVHPGFIFIWTSKMIYRSRRWTFELGTDSWLKTGERLTHIQASTEFQNTLALDIARKIWAYQYTVFGTAIYSIPRPHGDWKLSLHLASTLSTIGIGQEFIMSFAVEKNF